MRGFVSASSVTAFAVGVGMAAVALGQPSIAGKYSALWEVQVPGKASTIRLGADLEITKVEDNTVTGSLVRYGGTCRGTQAVTGKLEGDKLRLATVKGASDIQGCNMAFDLTVAGSKLKGTTGNGTPIEFTK